MRVFHGLLAGVLLALSVTAVARDDKNGGEIPQREAQTRMFGKDASYKEVERSEIERLTKAAARSYDEYYNTFRLKAWRVTVGDAPAGWFVTDDVIGKMEKIDYAVALDNSGTVQRVLILKYRESHGQEVKRPDWLAQFNGKGSAAPLKLRTDIDNITAATLSCDHLTDGIRKITRLFGPLPTPAP